MSSTTPTGERPFSDSIRPNKTNTKTTSGWTAFDIKQKRLKDHQPHHGSKKTDSEAFPLLSGTAPSFLSKNGAAVLDKPFASVVVASSSTYHHRSMDGNTDNSNKNVEGQVIPVSNPNQVAPRDMDACQRLNCLHPWADESLIQDVLACVNHNVDEALSLLEAMAISENKDTANKIVESDYEKEDASLDIPWVSSTKDTSVDRHVGFIDEGSSKLLLDASKFLPVEPEWEEDDVYLVHRKDAIRMMRSASRHSKAANEAYVRGDHLSAQSFSLKAQKERAAAEKLNAKAARELLTLRNSKNGPWTLDLHGLHAAEAVQALQEHLQFVECIILSNCISTENGIQKESGMLLSSSLQPLTRVEVEKSRRQHQLSRQGPTLLQVITGKGNHSRGAAALPPAIRNFLSENGYHFDEIRPGVIVIRPKFRRQ